MFPNHDQLTDRGNPSEDSQLSSEALLTAYQRVRDDLLAERNRHGYWQGELCSSPLATATAISALAIAEQHSNHSAASFVDEYGEIDQFNAAYQGDLSELICTSLRWLAHQQNKDGGWGDTDRSSSNLATTMLVLAAFRLTGVPAKFSDLESRAEKYIRSQGGVAGIKKRYSRDKTFVAPILTNCALAGMVSWKQVPALPFELAALPQKWFKWLQLPVVSYALPALVTIGMTKLHHSAPVNPITRWLRRSVIDRCLALVTKMQPDSGGFLEATPLTSFVVMALASTGRADHAVVRRGVEFLLASAREDGSWPIDINLACKNTSKALNALASGSPPEANHPSNAGIDWLLACQHTQPHPFTQAEPGGWAWTNLSGGVPDAGDTANTLTAFYHANQQDNLSTQQRDATTRAVRRGIGWLLDLQNADGGWPTFCRGWSKLPFDRSTTDLTAKVLVALDTWRDEIDWQAIDQHAQNGVSPSVSTNVSLARIDHAIDTGRAFLASSQQPAGQWIPLWFGNEHRADQTNPVYGTSRALLALLQLDGGKLMATTDAGLQWLLSQQHASGGWGTDPKVEVDDKPSELDDYADDSIEQDPSQPIATVEETAIAVEALLAIRTPDTNVRQAIDAGLHWLVDAIEQGEHHHASPLGLYFAKLWYYEKLYPLIFATGALGKALASRGIATNPRGQLATAQAC